MSNVLILCFGKNGSAPAFTLNMAQGLRKSGNCVYCVVSSAVSNRTDWESAQNNGLKVLFLETGNKKTFAAKSILFAVMGKKQISDFVDQEIDVSIQTFVHPWMNMINLWVKPGHAMAILHDPKPHSGERKLNIFLSEIQYGFIPEIIVLTKSFVPIVVEKYNKKQENVYFMHHGMFDSYRKRIPVPELPEYAKDKINFIFFGRIEKYKGIEVLLNAYEKLSADCHNITLTIAGSGSIEQYRQKISGLKNLVLINRYIEDEEVGTLFSGENIVLVLPYLDATQSGVTPVAVDFYVPIIASDSGGLKEQLNEGKLGIFVRPGDVNSLMYAMKEFATDPALLIKQKQLTEEFKRELEWDYIGQKLLTEINSRKCR